MNILIDPVVGGHPVSNLGGGWPHFMIRQYFQNRPCTCKISGVQALLILLIIELGEFRVGG